MGADELRRVRTYLARTGLAAAAIDELPGDASDRRYVRVRAQDGSSQVLLVHHGPIDTGTLPLLNVARLLARMDVPVPAVRGSAGDLGILALEDLGDVTLERFLATATAPQRRAAYADAVDLIARLQSRGRELAAPDYLPFTLAFDEAKLTWELDFFVEHFLLGYRRAPLSVAARAALGAELGALARALAAEPRVLCHRDYHSRNLMLHGGRLYVIDFQDARLGPDTYDLVSLLKDCYVRHEPSFVAEMVARYHERRGSAGGPAFDARFDRMAVQRHLKALGTFGYQATVGGNTRYLPAIPRTLDYLADVFRRAPGFERLRTLLAACGPAGARLASIRRGCAPNPRRPLAGTPTPRAAPAEARRARLAESHRSTAQTPGWSWANMTGVMHVHISEIADHEGREVTLRGWLHNRRSSGKIHFLTVRDGTGFVQAVLSKAAVGDEAFRDADHLGQETAVAVRGRVRADARAPGGFELDVTHLERVGPSQDYPITPKEHGVEYLLDRRHLWLRTARQQAILRIRHEVIDRIRTFFNSRGFVLVDTPILTPAACEGTTTLFSVPYFDHATAFLTQSGQLYNEANAMALGRVYCFGPTFRAEKSKTRRHLTEFWMVEPEMAYATLDDVTALAEELVAAVVQGVLDRRRPELAVLERDTAPLERVRAPFPRVSYDEAVELLRQDGREFEWGGDFGSPDETALAGRFDLPLVVHRFPSAAKAFYMQPDPERPDLSLSVDVLAPEGYGEIIGGGQRVDDYDTLLERLRAHDLPAETFEWYLDLRRYGSVPHGGFGMGVERVVAWICGLEHVREAIPYPRMLYRLTP